MGGGLVGCGLDAFVLDGGSFGAVFVVEGGSVGGWFGETLIGAGRRSTLALDFEFPESGEGSGVCSAACSDFTSSELLVDKDRIPGYDTKEGLCLESE